MAAPVVVQEELNTPFHQAKWSCFFNCFPITEPLDKLFFFFGAGADENLGLILFFSCFTSYM